MSAPQDSTRPGTLVTRLEHQSSGAAVVWVSGEIDTLTAPALDEALTALLAADPSDGVVGVELSGVGFLASSGLAVLIRAAHQARAQGRDLHLVAGGRAVARPLQVTGSDRLFTLHDDLSTLPGGASSQVD
ncbi:STAS domain-containing protein [Pseudonocardia oroxyli]|uniref:Anti-sigma factor antagonist n=1 Tax=Pseudonocardia oroxyli TaxID=366584 RepID=A0A1G7VIV8_PSEOR|nr:STAS domain-containing protein [Pseudonocardia oroxyli]SDG59762.1 anti-sigma B factor antagonist [Pseudonocardia oroxyli]